MYPIPSAARLDRMPAKSLSIVSLAAGSARYTPLIRRESKLGTCVAAGVGKYVMAGGVAPSACSAAWQLAQERNAVQIAKAHSFSMHNTPQRMLALLPLG